MKTPTSTHANASKLPVTANRLGKLLLGASFLLVSVGSGLAENPWSSSTMGWPAWDETTGGTFGGTFGGSSFEPHHLSHHYAPVPIAIHDSAIDPVMVTAGSIAEHRAQPHSTSMCWRYVKEALVAAGGVSSYPQTTYAKDAGRDLVENHGFVKLAVRSASRAPVGSVCVYGGTVAGHVELRTAHGYVSDYRCSRPSGLPFIGAYTRLEKHHKDARSAQISSGVIVAGL